MLDLYMKFGQNPFKNEAARSLTKSEHTFVRTYVRVLMYERNAISPLRLSLRGDNKVYIILQYYSIRVWEYD